MPTKLTRQRRQLALLSLHKARKRLHGLQVAATGFQRSNNLAHGSFYRPLSFGASELLLQKKTRSKMQADICCPFNVSERYHATKNFFSGIGLSNFFPCTTCLFALDPFQELSFQTSSFSGNICSEWILFRNCLFRLNPIQELSFQT